MKLKSERIPRLLLELPWLRHNRNVSFDSFCAEFDLTFQEAVEDLSLLTYVGPGKFGGELVDIQYDDENITVIDSQGLNKPLRFNRFEATVMMLGVRLIGEYSKEAPIISVEKKLTQLINDKNVSSENNNRYIENFEEIKKAIKDANSLRIDYVKSNYQTTTNRIIFPNRTYTINGIDYFDAINKSDGILKTYRVSRIVNISSMKEIREQRDVNIQLQSRNMATLRCKKWYVSRILDSNLEYIVSGEDVIINIEFFDDDYLLDLILRLGPETKVECEQSIKNRLRDLLDIRIASIL